MVVCLLVFSFSCMTTKFGGIYYFVREDQFEHLCFGYLNSQSMIGHTSPGILQRADFRQ